MCTRPGIFHNLSAAHRDSKRVQKLLALQGHTYFVCLVPAQTDQFYWLSNGGHSRRCVVAQRMSHPNVIPVAIL
jgi:hypothetical protein